MSFLLSTTSCCQESPSWRGLSPFLPFLGLVQLYHRTKLCTFVAVVAAGHSSTRICCNAVSDQGQSTAAVDRWSQASSAGGGPGSSPSHLIVWILNGWSHGYDRCGCDMVGARDQLWESHRQELKLFRSLTFLFHKSVVAIVIDNHCGQWWQECCWTLWI